MARGANKTRNAVLEMFLLHAANILNALEVARPELNAGACNWEFYSAAVKAAYNEVMYAEAQQIRKRTRVPAIPDLDGNHGRRLVTIGQPRFRDDSRQASLFAGPDDQRPNVRPTGRPDDTADCG